MDASGAVYNAAPVFLYQFKDHLVTGSDIVFHQFNKYYNYRRISTENAMKIGYFPSCFDKIRKQTRV